MSEPVLQTNRFSIIRRATLCLVVVPLISIFIVALASPGPAVQEQSKPAVGQQAASNARPAVGEKCITCHEQIVISFAQNLHGKNRNSLVESRANACEACHGNADKHIETLAVKDILNPAKLLGARANETCLQCHSEDIRRNDWHGGKHDRPDMSCLSCHSMHHSKSQERLNG